MTIPAVPCLETPRRHPPLARLRKRVLLQLITLLLRDLYLRLQALPGSSHQKELSAKQHRRKVKNMPGSTP